VSFLFDKNGWPIAAALAKLDAVAAIGKHAISAIQLPPLLHVFPIAVGELLQFPRPGQPVPEQPPGDPPAADHAMVADVIVRVPYLAGMDEIDVARAHCTVAAVADPFSYTSSKSGAGAHVDVVPPGPAIAGLLTHVVVHDLRPSVSGTDKMIFPDTSGSNQSTLWAVDPESGDVVVSQAASPPQGLPESKFLHAVLQARGPNGAFGPPMAAAPRFDMPGNQAGMYGPALGGLRARLAHQDGRVELTLFLDPPLPVPAFRVLLGVAGEKGMFPHAGLPNELVPAGWSAAEVTGHWQRRPSGLVIYALPGAGAGAGNEEAPATVATLAQEIGQRAADVDFTPAARSLLRGHYPNATGPDLELTLRVRADSPGQVRVGPDRLSARYLRVLGTADGHAVALRGAPERLVLPGVPVGLTPQAFSFAVDGSFGRAVLTAGADEPLPPGTSTGFRVAGSVRAARRMPLTTAERGQQLVRVGIFGRASADAELLVGLHQGDAMRVGAARGPTVSTAVPAGAHPAWHRADLPLELGLPPHPEALWVVVQVTRGVLWWYGALDQGSLLRSDDAGVTWSTVTGKPGLQLHVESVDPATRQPLPDQPVRMLRDSSQLTPDLAAIHLLGPPGEFRRHWVIDRSSDANALAALATLPDGALALSFACRRDVDLRVHDILLTYDPWQASG
jgi:hypothetical protein